LQGSICAGDFLGTHVLRFHGDVRVNQCASLDAYCDRMLRDPSFHAVVVDLQSTENLDSTTLGCLARLSIRVKKLNKRVPTLICDSDNLQRVLSSMGFQDVFMMVDRAAYDALSLPALPDGIELPAGTDLAMESTRARVIAAHKQLMAMNEQNAETFKDLVAALEREDCAQPICEKADAS
jgi:anti-anti-sigma factor